MSSLSPQQRQDIAELYLKKKEGKLDPHPSEYVHKMMAEFLLHYFLISTSETSYRTSKKEIDENEKPFKMPAPLYRGTVLLEKTHEFHCINLEKNSSSISITTPAAITYSSYDRNITLSFNNLNFSTPVKCGGKDFGIIVYFIVMLCATCKQNEANVEANFTIISLPQHEIRREIGPIQFKFPLLHNGYRTKVLQPLTPATKNSEHELVIPGDSYGTINNLNMQINQKKDSNYEIELIYLMIGFQCLENR